jgi:uncharacterized protein
VQEIHSDRPPSDWKFLACEDDGASSSGAKFHIILRVVIGSRAYGLSRDGSDTDVRGVYVPSASAHWSLAAVPEQLESEQEQTVIWEIEKFLRLALKGNPAILETLWSPVVLFASELGHDLVGLRQQVLSRAVYQSFLGYADAQFTSMQRAHDRGDPIKWRHAMHLIRLLMAGEELVRTSQLNLDARAIREELLAIRDGAVSWEDVSRRKSELARAFADSFARTSLPEEPDFVAADAFLIAVRRAMAERERSHD